MRNIIAAGLLSLLLIAMSSLADMQDSPLLQRIIKRVKCADTKYEVHKRLGLPKQTLDCMKKGSEVPIRSADQYGRYWIIYNSNAASLILDHSVFTDVCEIFSLNGQLYSSNTPLFYTDKIDLCEIKK